MTVWPCERCERVSAIAHEAGGRAGGTHGLEPQLGEVGVVLWWGGKGEGERGWEQERGGKGQGVP